ncbi:hypothetical protein [Rhizobium alvei]|uniref:Uncharacterized protein n=1 Tax=Rhizobium alvei TaxID=1132659 RepID=A0ABT8YNH3_9HYPH|nr:hypothetical protein [Rhizobium alvei]MDO6965192.1 hypothetical protein [Rhizobium alvei]
MADVSKLVDDLKQTYDEIKLKAHLGSKDAQDEWEGLQQKWQHFQSQAELQKSAADVGDALKILGNEISEAFGRIRKSL